MRYSSSMFCPNCGELIVAKNMQGLERELLNCYGWCTRCGREYTWVGWTNDYFMPYYTHVKEIKEDR